MGYKWIPSKIYHNRHELFVWGKHNVREGMDEFNILKFIRNAYPEDDFLYASDESSNNEENRLGLFYRALITNEQITLITLKFRHA